MLVIIEQNRVVNFLRYCSAIVALACCINVALYTRSIIVVAGEASGDRLGAWYIKNMREQLRESGEALSVKSVGGECLAAEGELLANYNDVNIRLIGISHHVKNISAAWKLWHALLARIGEELPDDVVLVDFPLFNIPLGLGIKHYYPHVRVTYIAPPELWLWGSYGIHRLFKHAADRVIVLYPHEVAWYGERGVCAEWLGHPLTKELQPYRCSIADREHAIALFPGSRPSELATMLPVFDKVIETLHIRYPYIRFIVSIADERSECIISNFFKNHSSRESILLVRNEHEKREAIARCCLAICKPGTCTLELGLLGVPMVIAFKVPWYTYWFARCTFQSSWVGLPNILLERDVCPELLQSACTTENITRDVMRLHESFAENNSSDYVNMIKELDRLWSAFAGEPNSR